MSPEIRAGLTYFTVVFGIGFVLGTFRVLVLIPYLGETPSVLLELPIILLLSWKLCRWLIRLFSVPARLSSRLAMGITAFGLLMIAEAALAIGLFGSSMPEHLTNYLSFHRAIGLSGQILFAFFPILQLRFP